MKSFKLVMITMIGTLIGHAMHASFTTVGGSKVLIYNQSDVAVTVNWSGANKDGQITTSSGPIPANSIGFIIYKPQTVYTNVTVIYAISNPDPVNISFTPGVLPTAIFVYGKSSVPLTSLDTSVAGTPVPSRYIAWWTGAINVATAANPNGLSLNAALSDAATQGLVKLYMASIDGKNTLIPF